MAGPAAAISGIKAGFELYTFIDNYGKPTEFDILSAKLDEIIALSEDILETVEQSVQNAITISLNAIKSDLLLSLSAYQKFADFGIAGEDTKAITFIQAAMSKLSVFEASNFGEYSSSASATLAPLLLAGTALRSKIAKDLEDADFAASLKSDLNDAEATLRSFLPELRDEIFNNMQVHQVSLTKLSGDHNSDTQVWRLGLQAEASSNQFIKGGIIYVDYSFYHFGVGVLVNTPDSGIFDGPLTFTPNLTFPEYGDITIDSLALINWLRDNDGGNYLNLVNTPLQYDQAAYSFDDLLQLADDLAWQAFGAIEEGTGGDDYLYVSSSTGKVGLDNTYKGFDGNDTLEGGAGDDSMDGGGDNDSIYAYDGDDALFGRSGDDLLQGGNGNDRVNGGDGIDTASYRNATNGVTVDLAIKIRQDTGQGWDRLSNIENLTGSFNYSDILKGNSLDNVLDGLKGNDQLFGLLGNDTLIGGLGDDLLDGGGGIDTAVYLGLDNAYISIGATGAQYTGYGNDTLISIENVTTGLGSDDVIGSSGDNVIKTGDATDYLNGKLGNDTLDGGNGSDYALFFDGTATTVDLNITGAQDTGSGQDTLIDIENVTTDLGADTLTGNGENNRFFTGDDDDTLNGGLGDDYLNGGDDFDTALFLGTTKVTVDLREVSAQDTGHGMDTLLNIEAIVSGSANDTLTGDALNNRFDSGAGKDLLKGEGGADILKSGNGADTVKGGLGKDLLQGGSGSDKLFGGKGIDKIEGGKGGDTIDGGKGNDTIKGGQGNDTLKGGDGSDDFVFVSGHGNDTIVDFDATNNAEDIDLKAVTRINDFNDLSNNHMTQVGNNVVIDDGRDLTITLLNVDLSDLGNNDFIF